MTDLVIRGGTVVDGSGAPGRRADVAIATGGSARSARCASAGAREIDAGGLVVARLHRRPHPLRRQYTWDPYATSSIWHGVTTTVIGNCGFAIAPCRPADRDLIMRTLVKVGGHVAGRDARPASPGASRPSPQYLDHLERCNPSLNVAALLGHSTIRQWVMGGDSQHRVRPPEEVAAMCGLVREAMAAGAIGLGSSTAEAHVGDGGLPVASRLADKAEFLALTKAMGEAGRGLFQATVGPKTTMEDLREIWKTSGRPVVWAAFFQRDDRPSTCRSASPSRRRSIARGWRCCRRSPAGRSRWTSR
jgi:N-acyl-D-aspartate/D-glutamate deacylase